MPAQLKRRLFIFLLIVLLIAGGFFAQRFFKGRFYESTDNAYVQGEITRVSSQLARASIRCWCRTGVVDQDVAGGVEDWGSALAENCGVLSDAFAGKPAPTFDRVRPDTLI